MNDDSKAEAPKNGAMPTGISDQPPVPKEMWKIEIFVDPSTGVEIQRATSPDPLVTPKFRSNVPVATNRGPMKIAFDVIDCTTIEEACARWPACAKRAVEEMTEQMKKQERRIVVPGSPKAPFPLKDSKGWN